MGARHYDPTIDGTFEQHQANRRAFRAQFATDGAIDKNQDAHRWAALDFLTKHPNATQDQLKSYLQSVVGMKMEKEGNMSGLKALLMDFDGTINGNYHYDLAKGMKFNTGTSDQNADWEPMTPEEIAQAQKTPAQRLMDELGVNQFIGRNNKKGHIPELQWDDTKKAWFDQDPEGRVYYDREGFVLDANGKRLGGAQHYYNPNHQQIRVPNAAPASTTPGTPTTTPAPTTTTPATSTVPGVHMPGTGGVNMPAVPGVAGVPSAPPPPGQQAAQAAPTAPAPAPTAQPTAQPTAPPPSTEPVAGPQAAPAGVQPPAATDPGVPSAPAPPGTAGAQAQAFMPGQGPGVMATSTAVPAAPPPAPATPEVISGIPPGGTLPTQYGNISRMPDGSLKLIANQVGQALRAKAVARIEKELGPRLFVGMPGAPRPEIVPGKHNYNPFTGRMAR